ncbi:MAG TPA: glycosyl hydrolase 115 family protein [Puia sp.]|nr:glycosyl hydrolase 115 family protein [Puia sp.]
MLATLVNILFLCSTSLLAQDAFRVTGNVRAGAFPLVIPGSGAPLVVDSTDAETVQMATKALAGDIRLVTGTEPAIIHNLDDKPAVIIGTIGRSKWIDRLVRQRKITVTNIRGRWEAFGIAIIAGAGGHRPKKSLVIYGSDPRGTVYGIFELSRKIGVSPWVWWADVTPATQKALYVSGKDLICPGPSVKYRGIFINDEDWGLRPWAAKTFDPAFGNIGPKTYARVYELLLRLRANTIWPAMHPGTTPFFEVEGNAETAKKYGIIIGTSHAEPMLCNNVGEWHKAAMGDFNYVTNRDSVYNYWKRKVIRTAGNPNIYTLGIRGIHDGKMEGASTLPEEAAVLSRVFDDQRGLLKKYVDSDITKVPQVFIPYKEVLPIYDYGVKVPDDVTLMWCDDNYGYIRHFPNAGERQRPGGNGIYYHISYWGAPHDYIWLGMTQPALVYQQMNMAYTQGARRIWILNVGDIKPSEYLVTLFLDMAWDIRAVKNVPEHLRRWLTAQFGDGVANELSPLLAEHYRLAHIRRPELMGNTRVYEKGHDTICDLPWSEKYIRRRLKAYDSLSEKVEKVYSKIANDKKAAYFELIEYPVQAAAEMNRKLLYAQLARHGREDWKQSDRAFDSIVALTGEYNSVNDGKWKGIMDDKPRNLPVFNRVKHDTAAAQWPPDHAPLYSFTGRGPGVIAGLGYEDKAIYIPEDSSLSFRFDTLPTDSVLVEVCLLPTHAVSGPTLRFSISLDQRPADTANYETKESSEEWKENVLRNQAIRRFVFPAARKQSHHIVIKALDQGVVVDQVKVYAGSPD